jgi:hypothetical protein
VVCLAPRALKESVRPRRPAGVVVRPLNFTVRSPAATAMRFWYSLGRSRLFGANFHIHLSVIVVTVIVAVSAVRSPAFAAVTLASFFGLILLHEWGHGAVAHYLGYSVQSIWLSAIHGRCYVEAPESQWDRSLIAWGGVGAQLVVAIPLIAFDSLWHSSLGILGPVVLIFGYYSCVLVILNLTPSRGLDGEVAWRIIPLLRKRLEARRAVRKTLDRLRRR